jgi:hypothetical protein
MLIGQEPIGRLDVMLFVDVASSVPPQLGKRELTTLEQSLHELTRACSRDRCPITVWLLSHCDRRRVTCMWASALWGVVTTIRSESPHARRSLSHEMSRPYG